MAAKKKAEQVDGPVLFVPVGDMHTNSRAGLCTPQVLDHDGGTYTANPFQQWLWREAWLPFWEEIAAVKKRENAHLLLVLMGDTSDINRYSFNDSISRNPAMVLRNTVKALEPAIGLADSLYVVRGTPSHTGDTSWLEESLAGDLSAIPYSKDKEIYSWYHLIIDVEGVVFDLKHHPESRDGTPRTRGASMIRIAADIVSYCAESGWTAPDIAIRAHGHVFRDSGENHRTRAFMIPSWQGPTDFLYKIGIGGQPMTFGSLYFLCKGGEYTYKKLFYRPSQPTMEKVVYVRARS